MSALLIITRHTEWIENLVTIETIIQTRIIGDHNYTVTAVYWFRAPDFSANQAADEGRHDRRISIIKSCKIKTSKNTSFRF